MEEGDELEEVSSGVRGYFMEEEDPGCIRFIEESLVKDGEHIFDSQGECMICGFKDSTKARKVVS